MAHLGLYGKLPTKGDFISRHLPDSFIQPWDLWLQQGLSQSKQQLGDTWLPTYIEAPVWSFVIPSGVLDKHGWAGIVAPSVDRVGRYFPLTFALPITRPVDVMALYWDNWSWYQGLLPLLYRALDPQCVLSELEAALQSYPTLIYRDGPFDPHQCPAPFVSFYSKIQQMNALRCLWGTHYGEPQQHCVVATAGLPLASMYRVWLDMDFAASNCLFALDPPSIVTN